MISSLFRNQLRNNFNFPLHYFARNISAITGTLKPQVLEKAEIDLFNVESPVTAPCILKGLADDWPAYKQSKWTMQGLVKHYGRKAFEIDACKSEPEFMTMGEYFAKHILPTMKSNQNDDSRSEVDDSSFHSTTPNPLNIFDSHFDFDNTEILDDYSIPKVFARYTRLTSTLPENLMPNHKWFVMGPKHAGTMFHADPLCTNAWNTLIAGSKQWFVVEPLTEEFFEENDGTATNNTTTSALTVTTEQNLRFWFKNLVPLAVKEIHKISPRHRVYLFTQQPGETVYIPAAWYHAVLNLEPSVAITHNFVRPDHIDVYLQLLKDNLEMNEEEYQMCFRELHRQKENLFGNKRK